MGFEYLVLDTGAIIKGNGLNLHLLTNKLVTISEVLAEIRDSKSRDLLNSIPHDIEIMIPSNESMKFVIEFSKKTGDYSSLSSTDLKLIALTHTLEVKSSGGSHLRTEPVSSIRKQSNDKKTVKPNEVITNNNNTKTDSPIIKSNEELTDDIIKGVINDIINLSIKSNEIKVNNITNESNNKQPTTQSISKIIGRSNYTNSNIQIEDDGLDWINHDNIHTINSSSNIRTIDKVVQVACMTSDYAMQNTLLQIGLNISSFDGKIIQSVKQWILRCVGCYTVHYDMSRLFCNNCGLSHLTKVSSHIDKSTGKLILHLKKNYQIKTRGLIYPLKSPDKILNANSSSRFNGDLLLREDQLLTGAWKYKSNQNNKRITSAFGEEITSDIGIDINQLNKIFVGYGKQNPNAMKGRERRGKRK